MESVKTADVKTSAYLKGLLVWVCNSVTKHPFYDYENGVGVMWRLLPSVFVSFRNRQQSVSKLYTVIVRRCERKTRFEMLSKAHIFCSSHNYFHHFLLYNWVQKKHACLRGKTVKKCALIPICAIHTLQRQTKESSWRATRGKNPLDVVKWPIARPNFIGAYWTPHTWSILHSEGCWRFSRSNALSLELENKPEA